MSPVVQKERSILDGPSRHRIQKGLLLLHAAGRPLDRSIQQSVTSRANQVLSADRDLRDFCIKADEQQMNLIAIVTPFHPVYTVNQRSILMQKLANVVKTLSQVARQAQCLLMGAGVNPLVTADSEERTLCADLHYIEVFDDGEVERIYNLFRQYLPELLAMATNSPILHGELQNDASARMRDHPQSFLPHYLSEFSVVRLEQIKRMMRKDFALSDLRFMDVNPLNQEEKLFAGRENTFQDPLPPSVELRFLDAQCSTSFIRAQLLLFQAISMYGRSLARRGRRLPRLKDKNIDENKALAYKDGMTAMLKPAEDRRKEAERRRTRDERERSESDEAEEREESYVGYTFHDKGKPELSSTALLMDIEGRLLPHLRDLDCQPWELFPLLLGPELRRQGKTCLGNYAELQQYLYYSQKQQFPRLFPQLVLELLSTPSADILCDFNRQTHLDLTREIELKWTQQLSEPPAEAGRARAKKQPEARKSANGHQAPRLPRPAPLQRPEQAVRPADAPPLPARGAPGRPHMPPPASQQASVAQRERGIVTKYMRGQGEVTSERGVVFEFTFAPLGAKKLFLGDSVLFEIRPGDTARNALNIQILPRQQEEGYVYEFDPVRLFGKVVRPSGQVLPFHGSDLENVTSVRAGQVIRFELVPLGDTFRAVSLNVQG